MAIMKERTNQKGKGGTMPLRLILKHVYIDCAFKINFKRGWGSNGSACSVTYLLFGKLLEIAVFSLQIFRWGGPPLPVTIAPFIFKTDSFI